MGTALLQHALAAQPEPLRSLKVVSAGVASRTGESASPHSITALKKVGVDLTGHVSRPVTQELLNRSRLFLFREFAEEGTDKEIPDPYGLPLPAYEASRDELVAAIPSIIGYLSNLPAAVLAGR